MIVGPAYIILVGLLIILAIKVMYIEPALKLHTVSDPTFLKQFMKKQFNAFNDPALLNELSGMTEDMTMDYWYMYYHIRTEDLTFFTLLNRINRFSENGPYIPICNTDPTPKYICYRNKRKNSS